MHSVVFGGFAAHELALRIDHAQPEVVVSASCGIEVNRVVHYKPLLRLGSGRGDLSAEHCIIVQRPQAEAPMIAWRDSYYHQAMAKAVRRAAYAGRDRSPLHPLHLGYDGSTQRGRVGECGSRRRLGLEHGQRLRGRARGDLLAASDVGWVVGHSYIVYAPLLVGATTVLYEGKPVGTPDAGRSGVSWPIHHGPDLVHRAIRDRAIKRGGPGG